MFFTYAARNKIVIVFDSDEENGSDAEPAEHKELNEMSDLAYRSSEDDGFDAPKLVKFPDNFETGMESSGESMTSVSDAETEDDSEYDVAGHKRRRVGSDSQVQLPRYDRSDKKGTIQHRSDAKRLLTSEDFQLLATLKEAYAKRLQDPKFRKKNKETVRQGAFVGDVDSDEEQSVAAGYTMTKDLLRPRVKTGRESKADRLVWSVW